MECFKTREDIRDLKRERAALEEGKEQFKNFMEKEKEQLRAEMQTAKEDLKSEKDQVKRSKHKFEVEVELHKQQCKEDEKKTGRERKEIQTQQYEVQMERRILAGTKKICTAQNKALLERELSVRKKEERVTKANLKSLKKEEKLKELHDDGEARLDLKKLIFSKEVEAQAKRSQKENEILTVREHDQQQREKQLKKDNETFSKEKDCVREERQSLLSREEYVHRIEVTIRAGMTDMFKRENDVEKREKAVEKRENDVEKILVKQKKSDERMSRERIDLDKAAVQMKRDSDSMFQREMKLWQDKKDLGKERKTFDATMSKARGDLSREKEKVRK